MSRKPPLSAKAASLLADLKANGSSRQSQYVETLVETAKKRKILSETALERKLAREEAEREDGPSMSFVTKEYQEKLESQDMGILLKGAEKVDSTTTTTISSKPQEKKMESQPVIDAAELIRRREARRAARVAPPSNLTEEMIEAARQRARQRLGIMT
jgi:hypothetical protein